MIEFYFQKSDPHPQSPTPYIFNSTKCALAPHQHFVPRKHVDHYVDVDQAEVDHVDVDQAEVVKASKTSSTVMAVEARANLKVSSHLPTIL